MKQCPPFSILSCVLACCFLLVLPLGTSLAEVPEPSPLDSALILLKTATIDTSAGAARATVSAELRGAPTSDGGWLLIHFAASSTDAQRRQLLAHLDADIAASIPRDTLLARIDSSSLGRLSADAIVTWVGRFHPAYKLANDLDELKTEKRLRLTLAPKADPAEMSAVLRATGIAVDEAWPGGMIVELDSRERLLALAHNSEILFIEAAVDARLLNDSSRGICQSGDPGNESIHAQGIRGNNQLVAVMDSGIDEQHCCFSGGKIVSNRAWGGGKLGALCANDHGTHVSGTVSCLNAGDHDGLAPDAELMMQDIQADGFFACNMGSVSPPGDLTPSWNDAYTLGARIHTNSWGGGSNSYGGQSQSIDSYIWEHQDFLIIYAAGNGGPSASSLCPYSNAKNSLTVGGSGNGGSRDNMYYSSSRGPAADGRTLPDLLTPGAGVSSSQNQSAPSCGWATHSGTSMAAPAAAGSAALVREYYERGFFPSGVASSPDGFNASAARVKATMLLSARNMGGSGVDGDRPNNSQGFGRLTLDDALWFASDAESERLLLLDDLDMGSGFSTQGEEHSFEIGLRSASALKVMLAWTDAPGSPSAQTALVNNLDLKVTLSNGRVYSGNQGFEGGWTRVESTATDDLNNKEAVFLESPAPGPITITVRAQTLGDVALHSQDYALLVVTDSDPSCSPSGTAAGVGNTATLERIGDDLRASWGDSNAESYTVYRGDSPNFMAHNPAPHADSVQDADSSSAGIQWIDSLAASNTESYYYVFYARNDCDELLP